MNFRSLKRKAKSKIADFPSFGENFFSEKNAFKNHMKNNDIYINENW
jgi:hypothetical protein